MYIYIRRERGRCCHKNSLCYSNILSTHKQVRRLGSLGSLEH